MSVARTIRRYRDDDHDAVWVLQHMAEGTLTADEVPPARADDPDYAMAYARAHDVERGGMYDARSAAINIWSHSWLTLELRQASELIGTIGRGAWPRRSITPAKTLKGCAPTIA
jgi:hypothetical protein